MKLQTAIPFSRQWDFAAQGVALSIQESVILPANDDAVPSEYFGFGDGPF